MWKNVKGGRRKAFFFCLFPQFFFRGRKSGKGGKKEKTSPPGFFFFIRKTFAEMGNCRKHDMLFFLLRQAFHGGGNPREKGKKPPLSFSCKHSMTFHFKQEKGARRGKGENKTDSREIPEKFRILESSGTESHKNCRRPVLSFPFLSGKQARTERMN